MQSLKAKEKQWLMQNMHCVRMGRIMYYSGLYIVCGVLWSWWDVVLSVVAAVAGVLRWSTLYWQSMTSGMTLTTQISCEGHLV